MLEYLKTNWIVLSGLLAVGMAWGDTARQVKELQDEKESYRQVQQQVGEIKTQAARVDERTQSIKESQARTERLLEQLLIKQNSIEKKIDRQ